LVGLPRQEGRRTPGYLSPEVCLGNPVDQRSDLFALGIVLFEMLTGRLPFVEASPLKLMLSVVESALPDVRQLNAQVDAESAAILQRLLAKDPKSRYQSAQELLVDLDQHSSFSRSTPLTVKIRLPDLVATRELRTPGQAGAPPPATELTPSGNRNPASLQRRGLKKIAYLGIAGAIALILGAVAWQTHEPRLGDESIPSTVEKAAASVAHTAEDPSQKLPPDIGEAGAMASAPEEVATSRPSQKSTAPTLSTSVATDSEAKPLIKPISNAAPTEQELATPPREVVEKYAALYLGPHNETVAIARSAEQSEDRNGRIDSSPDLRA
jgi:serine/threonine-protein kinase